MFQPAHVARHVIRRWTTKQRNTIDISNERLGMQGFQVDKKHFF